MERALGRGFAENPCGDGRAEQRSQDVQGRLVGVGGGHHARHITRHTGQLRSS